MTLTPQTPMLRQYQELKKQHPGTLLFFRLGDFYELFYDDAVTSARELQITLTARHKERGDPVPMCGVPHHAAATHIAKLVRKGYRVAICEQTEEASKTKKLVRREVVRIITPGTAVDPQLLDERESVYLAAVCGSGDQMAAAFLDLSTGEFRVTDTHGKESWPKIIADIEAYAPRELLFPASLAQLLQNAHQTSPRTAPLPLTKNPSATPETLSDASKDTDALSESHAAMSARKASTDAVFGGATLTPLDDWLWQREACAELLREHFHVLSLDAFNLEDKFEAVRAAGVCLRYAQETQRAAAAHVTEINYFEPQNHLVLDAVTVRNLELVQMQPAQKRAHAVIDVIDDTMTNMGARLLRSWLLRPSVRRGEIEARHAAVQDIYASQIKRDQLRARLKVVADMERLAGRLNMNNATARDLVALRSSLEEVPKIKETLSDASSSLLQILYESADELGDVRSLIARAISDEPPAKLSDGGAVREKYSQELDELRAISRDAKQTIATIEARERARSGISSLRVRFNGVFGYFIEVSKAAAMRVPADYERRQTLANAERYTTPELKEWETKVLGAEDRITQLEMEIFQQVCRDIAVETRRIQATARALASLDALASLAEVAVRRRYVRPTMHDGDEIKIVAGRHPVVEALSDDPFIANDVYMNNSTDRLLIITGPNMGGKSTVLRQTAIINILAQMGSFVPAERASLPVLDRVWTRVGASDDLAHGRSTFMVEMTETATILHNATPRSLILLDEIGRGTATFDGLSIAWAVAEFLHDSAEHAAKTLFATHYHELTELAERLPGAQNYQITAAEREGEVVFLHRLERGRASKSYGIEVARLAGLPAPVLLRARDVLARLERYELDVFAEEMKQTNAGDGGALQTQSQAQNLHADDGALGAVARRAGRRRIAAQVTLFDAANKSVLDELRDLNVENLAPEEARALLSGLRERLI
ncbi:MAG: DNA mismatch repair protein MutS [Pyrinomonadaceae bacterium]